MRAAGLAVRDIPEDSGVELGSGWGASPHKLSGPGEEGAESGWTALVVTILSPCDAER